ncbi:MAG: PAS domain S-box protein [Deltaproteobacteria bacterium]|nr:PAS domain S-box protein [Deltaproteobacteria bacterium]
MSKKPTYEDLEQRVKVLEAERERLRQSVKALRKRQGEYLDIAGVMFVALDKEQNVVMINKKGCAILGYEEHEIVGKNWFENFVQPESVGELRRVFEQVISGSIEEVEYHENPVLTKDGEERIIAWHNSVITDALGDIVGTLSSGQDITEEKRARAALCDSEKRLKSIFRVAPTGIGVVKDRILLDVNPRICEMTGYAEDELVGQSARILYPSEEEFEFVGKEKYRQIEQRGTGVVETRWRKKDGVVIDILLASTPIDNNDPSKGITFTALDITDRKQAEIELSIRNRILEAFLTKAENDMYHEVLQVVLRAFDSECGVFGYIDKKGNLVCPTMIGQIWKQCRVADKDIVFPEHTWGKTIWGEALRTGKSNYSNGPFDMPEGHIAIKNCLTAPLVVREKSIGLLTVSNKKGGYHERDRRLLERISDSIAPVLQARLERRQIEYDKKQLESRLRRVQRMEAIGTLAGGIAHDFNNILTPILVQTELAKLSIADDDPVQTSLDEVLKAGLRAKDLVQQILAFSRESEQQFTSIDLVPIVKESLKLLRSTIPKSIEIRKNFKSPRCIVKADPGKMQEVIMNLCTNAAQAMKEPGSVLNVSLESVALNENDTRSFPDIRPGPYVMLAVSDTGSGIEPELLEKIFDPFFTTKPPGEGTGMGLAVVHGIVKSHAGAITVESEPGKGTTFRVLLPKVNHEEALVENGHDRYALPTGKERILFVDDEVSLVRLVEQMLKLLGYQVETRTSPIEALAAFQHHPDQYDLVMTDMTMPNMTGDVLAKEFMRVRADIPVIICTGFSHQMDQEKASALGIRAFVMKPFAIKEVAEAIRKVLDT